MSKNLESLRRQAATLFEEKRFKDIVALLTDEVLEKNKDAELYAWRARGHYKLEDDADKIMQFAQKAIDVDTNYYMGFLARGVAWNNKGEYNKALTDYNRAIELKNNDPHSYINRGNIWYNFGDFEKAIEDYDKAAQINPNDDLVYFNRGSLMFYMGNYATAIADYSKAIELNPMDARSYVNRGKVWSALNENNKALTDYNKAIKLNPGDAQAYYYRGILKKHAGKDLIGSVKDFENVLRLTPDKDSFLSKWARNNLQELREKSKDSQLREIGDLVLKIKKLLLITKGCITHYTGLTVTKKLIVEKENKFRISEGAFLNDTSEGTELFEFLQHKFSTLTDGLLAETFAPKPFIGSFVAESKHDDLNLWRFYGKENGVEAKGCAMTLRMKEFIDAINLSVTNNSTKQITSSEDDINFYRVAYWDHDKVRINFQIPNSTKKIEKALNKLMGELKDKVAKYKTEDKSILEKYLNSIAFLFKSDAYKNENELRLVIKGIEFEKRFDLEANPPRVYIELINIRHLVEQITLGPKVDKPDEWAAAFYYSYDSEIDDTKKPKKILISRLPYK